MIVAMGRTLPPEEPVEPPRDEAETSRTLVEIMRRQRERDRRVLRVATIVAVIAFVYAIAATVVAWGQHAGWRLTARRPAANSHRHRPGHSQRLPSVAPRSRAAPPRAHRQPSAPPSSRPCRPCRSPTSPSTPSEPPSEPSSTSRHRPRRRVDLRAPAVSSRHRQWHRRRPVRRHRRRAPPSPSDGAPAVEAPARPQPAPPSTSAAPPASSPVRVLAERTIRSGPPGALAGDPDENASPPTDRPVARAPRPEREAEPSRGATAAAPAFGDVNVRVGSTRDERGELRDYIVTLKDSQGAAFTGADVRLQGRMADRRLVEVVLDPAAQPGQYRAAVRMSPEGPADLRLRITVHGTTVVVPINASTPSGS